MLTSSLLLLLATVPAAPPAEEATSNPARQFTLSAGYLGEFFTHPGAFVGLERPLLAGRHHALFVGARLGATHHVNHHTGLLLRAEVGYRATADVGLFGEVLAGIGAHDRFLPGPVYVESAGGVTEQADTGRLTVMPGLALGAGWAFSRRGPWPTRVFARADGWARAPVNGGWLPGLAVSLGVAWTLGAAP